MTLSGLTIGSLTLDPAFDKNVTEYTADTLNATNKITAVADDEDANIKIEVNGVEIENESSATWIEGENSVDVVVTNGGKTKSYQVEVSYYPEVEFTFDPEGLTANETDGLSDDTVTIEGIDTYDIEVTSATADNEHITVTASSGVLTVSCDDDTVLTNENLPITVTVVGKRDKNPATGTFEITYE